MEALHLPCELEMGELEGGGRGRAMTRPPRKTGWLAPVPHPGACCSNSPNTRGPFHHLSDAQGEASFP